MQITDSFSAWCTAALKGQRDAQWTCRNKTARGLKEQNKIRQKREGDWSDKNHKNTDEDLTASQKCYKLRHGNWRYYNLLYRMFCVPETLLFPFGHFVIKLCFQNYVCAYYQIWLSKCLNHFVPWPCLYQLNVNDQIKIIFNYVTINPLFSSLQCCCPVMWL